eukprot:14182955-Alexandrium_andersonii.AAC.1
MIRTRSAAPRRLRPRVGSRPQRPGARHHRAQGVSAGPCSQRAANRQSGGPSSSSSSTAWANAAPPSSSPAA